MSGDVASLAAEMTPYISAAAGAYGGAVLARVRDDAADATVGLGRRLLQRVFGTKDEGEPLPGPLADLAADPEDGDALAAVRLLVRRALAADPVLAAEVRSMLVGVGGQVQQVRAGQDAFAAAGNQTIINYQRPEQAERRPLADFFSAGCGVGNRVAIMHYRNDEFPDFLEALRRTGASPGELQEFDEFPETRNSLSETGRVSRLRYFNAMRATVPQMRSRATGEQLQWFNLGKLLYEPVTLATMQPLTGIDAAEARQAVIYLAEEMRIPGSLRASVIDFATDSGPGNDPAPGENLRQVNYLLERADKIAGACRRFL